MPVSRWCARGLSRVALLSSNSLLAVSSLATIHRCMSTVSKVKHDSTHELKRMTKFHGVEDGSENGAAKMLMGNTSPEAMSQSLRHLLHTTQHYTSSLLSILLKEASVSEQAASEHPPETMVYHTPSSCGGRAEPNRRVRSQSMDSPHPRTPPSSVGALNGYQP